MHSIHRLSPECRYNARKRPRNGRNNRVNDRGVLMRSSFYALVAALFFIPGIGASQEIAEPFKVGTFDINGKPGVGVVLRDRLILELDAANAALEENPSYP